MYVHNCMSCHCIPTLYYDELCPQSRSCVMVAKIINLKLELKPINLIQGEKLCESFKKINPSGTMPTLVDSHLVLCNSNTIMLYMCDKYGTTNSQICPRDYLIRLNILNMLFFESSVLYPHYNQLTTDILVKKYPNVDMSFHCPKAVACYTTLETTLTTCTFLTGENVTVADVATVSTVSAIDCIFPILQDLWPNLYAWLQQLKAMDWYQCNKVGLKKSFDYLVSKGRLTIETDSPSRSSTSSTTKCSRPKKCVAAPRRCGGSQKVQAFSFRDGYEKLALRGGAEEENNKKDDPNADKRPSDAANNGQRPSDAANAEKRPSGEANDEMRPSSAANNGQRPSGAANDEMRPSGAANGERLSSDATKDEKSPSVAANDTNGAIVAANNVTENEPSDAANAQKRRSSSEPLSFQNKEELEKALVDKLPKRHTLISFRTDKLNIDPFACACQKEEYEIIQCRSCVGLENYPTWCANDENVKRTDEYCDTVFECCDNPECKSCVFAKTFLGWHEKANCEEDDDDCNKPREIYTQMEWACVIDTDVDYDSHGSEEEDDEDDIAAERARRRKLKEAKKKLKEKERERQKQKEEDKKRRMEEREKEKERKRREREEERARQKLRLKKILKVPEILKVKVEEEEEEESDQEPDYVCWCGKDQALLDKQFEHVYESTFTFGKGKADRKETKPRPQPRFNDDDNDGYDDRYGNNGRQVPQFGFYDEQIGAYGCGCGIDGMNEVSNAPRDVSSFQEAIFDIPTPEDLEPRIPDKQYLIDKKALLDVKYKDLVAGTPYEYKENDDIENQQDGQEPLLNDNMNQTAENIQNQQGAKTSLTDNNIQNQQGAKASLTNNDIQNQQGAKASLTNNDIQNQQEVRASLTNNDIKNQQGAKASLTNNNIQNQQEARTSLTNNDNQNQQEVRASLTKNNTNMNVEKNEKRKQRKPVFEDEKQRQSSSKGDIAYQRGGETFDYSSTNINMKKRHRHKYKIARRLLKEYMSYQRGGASLDYSSINMKETDVANPAIQNEPECHCTDTDKIDKRRRRKSSHKRAQNIKECDCSDSDADDNDNQQYYVGKRRSRRSSHKRDQILLECTCPNSDADDNCQECYGEKRRSRRSSSNNRDQILQECDCSNSDADDNCQQCYGEKRRSRRSSSNNRDQNLQECDCSNSDADANSDADNKDCQPCCVDKRRSRRSSHKRDQIMPECNCSNSDADADSDSEYYARKKRSRRSSHKRVPNIHEYNCSDSDADDDERECRCSNSDNIGQYYVGKRRYRRSSHKRFQNIQECDCSDSDVEDSDSQQYSAYRKKSRKSNHKRDLNYDEIPCCCDDGKKTSSRVKGDVYKCECLDLDADNMDSDNYYGDRRQNWNDSYKRNRNFNEMTCTCDDGKKKTSRVKNEICEICECSDSNADDIDTQHYYVDTRSSRKGSYKRDTNFNGNNCCCDNYKKKTSRVKANVLECECSYSDVENIDSQQYNIDRRRSQKGTNKRDNNFIGTTCCCNKNQQTTSHVYDNLLKCECSDMGADDISNRQYYRDRGRPNRLKNIDNISSYGADYKRNENDAACCCCNDVKKKPQVNCNICDTPRQHIRSDQKAISNQKNNSDELLCYCEEDQQTLPRVDDKKKQANALECDNKIEKLICSCDDDQQNPSKVNDAPHECNCSNQNATESPQKGTFINVNNSESLCHCDDEQQTSSQLSDDINKSKRAIMDKKHEGNAMSSTSTYTTSVNYSEVLMVCYNNDQQTPSVLSDDITKYKGAIMQAQKIDRKQYQYYSGSPRGTLTIVNNVVNKGPIMQAPMIDREQNQYYTGRPKRTIPGVNNAENLMCSCDDDQKPPLVVSDGVPDCECSLTDAKEIDNKINKSDSLMCYCDDDQKPTSAGSEGMHDCKCSIKDAKETNKSDSPMCYCDDDQKPTSVGRDGVHDCKCSITDAKEIDNKINKSDSLMCHCDDDENPPSALSDGEPHCECSITDAIEIDNKINKSDSLMCCCDDDQNPPSALSDGEPNCECSITDAIEIDNKINKSDSLMCCCDDDQNPPSALSDGEPNCECSITDAIEIDNKINKSDSLMCCCDDDQNPPSALSDGEPNCECSITDAEEIDNKHNQFENLMCCCDNDQKTSSRRPYNSESFICYWGVGQKTPSVLSGGVPNCECSITDTEEIDNKHNRSDSLMCCCDDDQKLPSLVSDGISDCECPITDAKEIDNKHNKSDSLMCCCDDSQKTSEINSESMICFCDYDEQTPSVQSECGYSITIAHGLGNEPCCKECECNQEIPPPVVRNDVREYKYSNIENNKYGDSPKSMSTCRSEEMFCICDFNQLTSPRVSAEDLERKSSYNISNSKEMFCTCDDEQLMPERVNAGAPECTCSDVDVGATNVKQHYIDGGRPCKNLDDLFCTCDDEELAPVRGGTSSDVDANGIHVNQYYVDENDVENSEDLFCNCDIDHRLPSQDVNADGGSLKSSRSFDQNSEDMFCTCDDDQQAYVVKYECPDDNADGRCPKSTSCCDQNSEDMFCTCDDDQLTYIVEGGSPVGRADGGSPNSTCCCDQTSQDRFFNCDDDQRTHVVECESPEGDADGGSPKSTCCYDQNSEDMYCDCNDDQRTTSQECAGALECECPDINADGGGPKSSCCCDQNSQQLYCYDDECTTSQECAGAHECECPDINADGGSPKNTCCCDQNSQQLYCYGDECTTSQECAGALECECPDINADGGSPRSTCCCDQNSQQLYCYDDECTTSQECAGALKCGCPDVNGDGGSPNSTCRCDQYSEDLACTCDDDQQTDNKCTAPPINKCCIEYQHYIDLRNRKSTSSNVKNSKDVSCCQDNQQTRQQENDVKDQCDCNEAHDIKDYKQHGGKDQQNNKESTNDFGNDKNNISNFIWCCDSTTIMNNNNPEGYWCCEDCMAAVLSSRGCGKKSHKRCDCKNEQESLLKTSQKIQCCSDGYNMNFPIKTLKNNDTNYAAINAPFNTKLQLIDNALRCPLAYCCLDNDNTHMVESIVYIYRKPISEPEDRTRYASGQSVQTDCKMSDIIQMEKRTFEDRAFIASTGNGKEYTTEPTKNTSRPMENLNFCSKMQASRNVNSDQQRYRETIQHLENRHEKPMENNGIRYSESKSCGHSDVSERNDTIAKPNGSGTDSIQWNPKAQTYTSIRRENEQQDEATQRLASGPISKTPAKSAECEIRPGISFCISDFEGNVKTDAKEQKKRTCVNLKDKILAKEIALNASEKVAIMRQKESWPNSLPVAETQKMPFKEETENKMSIHNNKATMGILKPTTNKSVSKIPKRVQYDQAAKTIVNKKTIDKNQVQRVKQLDENFTGYRNASPGMTKQPNYSSSRSGSNDRRRLSQDRSKGSQPMDVKHRKSPNVGLRPSGGHSTISQKNTICTKDTWPQPNGSRSATSQKNKICTFDNKTCSPTSCCNSATLPKNKICYLDKHAGHTGAIKRPTSCSDVDNRHSENKAASVKQVTSTSRHVAKKRDRLKAGSSTSKTNSLLCCFCMPSTSKKKTIECPTKTTVTTNRVCQNSMPCISQAVDTEVNKIHNLIEQSQAANIKKRTKKRSKIPRLKGRNFYLVCQTPDNTKSCMKYANSLAQSNSSSYCSSSSHVSRIPRIRPSSSALKLEPKAIKSDEKKGCFLSTLLKKIRPSSTCCKSSTNVKSYQCPRCNKCRKIIRKDRPLFSSCESFQKHKQLECNQGNDQEEPCGGCFSERASDVRTGNVYNIFVMPDKSPGFHKVVTNENDAVREVARPSSHTAVCSKDVQCCRNAQSIKLPMYLQSPSFEPNKTIPLQFSYKKLPPKQDCNFRESAYFPNKPSECFNPGTNSCFYMPRKNSGSDRIRGGLNNIGKKSTKQKHGDKNSFKKKPTKKSTKTKTPLLKLCASPRRILFPARNKPKKLNLSTNVCKEKTDFVDSRNNAECQQYHVSEKHSAHAIPLSTMQSPNTTNSAVAEETTSSPIKNDAVPQTITEQKPPAVSKSQINKGKNRYQFPHAAPKIGPNLPVYPTSLKYIPAKSPQPPTTINIKAPANATNTKKVEKSTDKYNIVVEVKSNAPSTVSGLAEGKSTSMVKNKMPIKSPIPEKANVKKDIKSPNPTNYLVNQKVKTPLSPKINAVNQNVKALGAKNNVKAPSQTNNDAMDQKEKITPNQMYNTVEQNGKTPGLINNAVEQTNKAVDKKGKTPFQTYNAVDKKGKTPFQTYNAVDKKMKTPTQTNNAVEQKTNSSTQTTNAVVEKANSPTQTNNAVEQKVKTPTQKYNAVNRKLKTPSQKNNTVDKNVQIPSQTNNALDENQIFPSVTNNFVDGNSLPSGKANKTVNKKQWRRPSQTNKTVEQQGQKVKSVVDPRYVMDTGEGNYTANDAGMPEITVKKIDIISKPEIKPSTNSEMAKIFLREAYAAMDGNFTNDLEKLLNRTNLPQIFQVKNQKLSGGRESCTRANETIYTVLECECGRSIPCPFRQNVQRVVCGNCSEVDQGRTDENPMPDGEIKSDDAAAGSSQKGDSNDVDNEKVMGNRKSDDGCVHETICHVIICTCGRQITCPIGQHVFPITIQKSEVTNNLKDNAPEKSSTGEDQECDKDSKRPSDLSGAKENQNQSARTSNQSPADDATQLQSSGNGATNFICKCGRRIQCDCERKDLPMELSENQNGEKVVNERQSRSSESRSSSISTSQPKKNAKQNGKPTSQQNSKENTPTNTTPVDSQESSGNGQSTSSCTCCKQISFSQETANDGKPRNSNNKVFIKCPALSKTNGMQKGKLPSQPNVEEENLSNSSQMQASENRKSISKCSCGRTIPCPFRQNIQPMARRSSDNDKSEMNDICKDQDTFDDGKPRGSKAKTSTRCQCPQKMQIKNNAKQRQMLPSEENGEEENLSNNSQVGSQASCENEKSISTCSCGRPIPCPYRQNIQPMARRSSDNDKLEKNGNGNDRGSLNDGKSTISKQSMSTGCKCAQKSQAKTNAKQNGEEEDNRPSNSQVDSQAASEQGVCKSPCECIRQIPCPFRQNTQPMARRCSDNGKSEKNGNGSNQGSFDDGKSTITKQSGSTGCKCAQKSQAKTNAKQQEMLPSEHNGEEDNLSHISQADSQSSSENGKINSRRICGRTVPCPYRKNTQPTKWCSNWNDKPERNSKDIDREAQDDGKSRNLKQKTQANKNAKQKGKPPSKQIADDDNISDDSQEDTQEPSETNKNHCVCNCLCIKTASCPFKQNTQPVLNDSSEKETPKSNGKPKDKETLDGGKSRKPGNKKPTSTSPQAIKNAKPKGKPPNQSKLDSEDNQLRAGQEAGRKESVSQFILCTCGQKIPCLPRENAQETEATGSKKEKPQAGKKDNKSKLEKSPSNVNQAEKKDDALYFCTCGKQIPCPYKTELPAKESFEAVKEKICRFLKCGENDGKQYILSSDAQSDNKANKTSSLKGDTKKSSGKSLQATPNADVQPAKRGIANRNVKSRDDDNANETEAKNNKSKSYTPNVDRTKTKNVPGTSGMKTSRQQQQNESITSKDIMPTAPGTLKAKSSAVSQDLKAKSSSVSQDLKGKSSAVSQDLKGKSSAVSQDLKGKSSAVTQDLKGKSGAVAQDPKAKSGAAAQNLKGKSSTVTQDLKGKSDAVPQDQNTKSGVRCSNSSGNLEIIFQNSKCCAKICCGEQSFNNNKHQLETQSRMKPQTSQSSIKNSPASVADKKQIKPSQSKAQQLPKTSQASMKKGNAEAPETSTGVIKKTTTNSKEKSPAKKSGLNDTQSEINKEKSLGKKNGPQSDIKQEKSLGKKTGPNGNQSENKQEKSLGKKNGPSGTQSEKKQEKSLGKKNGAKGAQSEMKKEKSLAKKNGVNGNETDVKQDLNTSQAAAKKPTDGKLCEMTDEEFIKDFNLDFNSISGSCDVMVVTKRTQVFKMNGAEKVEEKRLVITKPSTSKMAMPDGVPDNDSEVTKNYTRVGSTVCTFITKTEHMDKDS